jgi:hypothetical protein
VDGDTDWISWHRKKSEREAPDTGRRSIAAQWRWPISWLVVIQMPHDVADRAVIRWQTQFSPPATRVERRAGLGD